MNGLVEGPLLVGGLGPRRLPPPPISGPALSAGAGCFLTVT